MLKNKTAIILVLVFVCSIMMPLVVMLRNNTINISVFCDTPLGEDNDTHQEKNNEKERIVSKVNTILKIRTKKCNTNSRQYIKKVYQKPSIKMVFPPPKILA